MSTASLRKPLLVVALVTVLLLLVPLAAMQFTAEVAWGAGDFLVAAALLFAAGAAMVVAARHVRGAGRRAAAIAAIAAGAALVWVELAVGWFR